MSIFDTLYNDVYRLVAIPVKLIRFFRGFFSLKKKGRRKIKGGGGVALKSPNSAGEILRPTESGSSKAQTNMFIDLQTFIH